jgi:hypothetical protein
MKHVIALAALALVAACTAHHTESDSKSNWLRQCASQSDCPESGSCVCGVCTKACESSDACGALSDQAAVCVSPTQQGLPACDSDPNPVSESRICLLACKQNAECGTAQSCVKDVCISATLVDGGVQATSGTDGGTKVPPVRNPLDAGGTPPNKGFDGGGIPPNKGFDGGGIPPNPTLDAGGTPPVITLDAGKTNPVIDPQPSDDDAGTDKDCAPGLVRHIDQTCIEPGVDDANGVATLVPTLPQRSYVLAADLEYVYGLRRVSKANGASAILMRWPTDGGDGEPLAGGMIFQVPSAQPMIVDATRLYFIAATDPAELSSTLWSMPKDDSAPPVAHGFVGKLLAQDQDYLYFTNDGDSRLVRAGKATLDSSQMTEQVYISSSDSPGQIWALAVNTDSVFVDEVPPHGSGSTTFTIQRIAKATSAVTTLGTNDRFSATSIVSIVADDSYFVLGGYGTDRLQLATSEVKPLGLSANLLWLDAGTLYGANSGTTASGSLWRVDLTTLRLQKFLTKYKLYVTSMVENDGSMFVTLEYNNTDPNVLLRVTPQP